MIKTVVTALIMSVSFVQNHSFQNGNNVHVSAGDVSSQVAEIKWEVQELNLGTMNHLAPKTVNFEFVNTGNIPFIITDVKTSCGCTVAEFPKEAVMPGNKGVIKATYNAATVGPFSKTLLVSGNMVGGMSTLTIHGEVR